MGPFSVDEIMILRLHYNQGLLLDLTTSKFMMASVQSFLAQNQAFHHSVCQ